MENHETRNQFLVSSTCARYVSENRIPVNFTLDDTQKISDSVDFRISAVLLSSARDFCQKIVPKPVIRLPIMGFIEIALKSIRRPQNEAELSKSSIEFLSNIHRLCPAIARMEAMIGNFAPDSAAEYRTKRRRDAGSQLVFKVKPNRAVVARTSPAWFRRSLARSPYPQPPGISAIRSFRTKAEWLRGLWRNGFQLSSVEQRLTPHGNREQSRIF